MQEAVIIFNVQNPMIMRKAPPQKPPVRSLLKMLFTTIKEFFTETNNREFRRLKDFISS